MTAAILPFKRPAKKQLPHCNCKISPEPKEPPKRIWNAHGWVCSCCGNLLMRRDLAEEEGMNQ